MIDNATEIARLRAMLAWPEMTQKADTLRRRIFALEIDIPYTNPFYGCDEMLYQIGGRQ